MSAMQRTVVRPARPEVALPEWLLVAAMDDMRRFAEKSVEGHDRVAAELGFGRKRIEAVQPGDVLRLKYAWREVTRREENIAPDGMPLGWNVWYTDGTWGRFDPQQFVSYQVDLTDEAF